MKQTAKRRLTVALVAVLAIVGAGLFSTPQAIAQDAATHDEAVNGDLSDAFDAPTALAFGVGANTITGTTGDGPGGGTTGLDADYFTFSLDEGQSVSSVTTTRSGPGERSFLGFVGGTAFTGQMEEDIAGFTLFDNGDITGVLPMIGAGDHSFWIQEVAGPTDYSITFNVVEEAIPPAPDGPADGDVVLFESFNGRFLDGDGGSQRFFPEVNSSRIARADDRWILHDIGDGYWAIQSEMFGLYLDADNAGQDFNVNLGPADNRGIEWEIIPLDDGYYVLRNVDFPDRYLNHASNRNVNTTDVASPSVHWNILPADMPPPPPPPPPVPPQTFEVTFSNLSTGQPMTPPVVAIHDAAAIQLFNVGEAVIDPVREIAENGNNGPLVDLATSAPAEVVSAAGVAFVDPAAPGPVFPGETASVQLTSDAAGHSLSLVSMVVCTNDGFTGLNSIELPAGAESVRVAVAPYDAGSEVNDLDADYWVPPCGGSGANLHADENGVIAAHPGQSGVGQFDFDGSADIAYITITNLTAGGVTPPPPVPPAPPAPAQTFEVTVTNDTTGQPMTPPVVAIHDAAAIQLFNVGEAVIDPVREIAENGNNGPLVDLATSAPAEVVSAAGVAFVDPAAPGPVFPGETASVQLTTDAAGHSLSLVSMVVCTNDGFTGLNSIELPAAGQTVTVQVLAYDAGSEVNDLDADYWVPPCGGSGDNLHTDENGVIAAHPGQTGVGQFDFDGSVAVATVTIANLGAPAL